VNRTPSPPLSTAPLSPPAFLRIGFSLAALLTAQSATAQSAPSPNAVAPNAASQNAPRDPVVGRLHMPLVTPEQAAQFFSGRTVPASHAEGADRAAAARAHQPPQLPQAANVEPANGHERPTGAKTPGGFARADFAIAAPPASAPTSPAGDGVGPSRQQAPRPEAPPSIGGR